MDSIEQDNYLDQTEQYSETGETAYESEMSSVSEKFSDSSDSDTVEDQTVKTVHTVLSFIRKVLSFDWITNEFFQRQVALVILLVILTIIYITNRYMSQRELVRIQELKVERQEKQYIWLNTQSDVSASTRPSTIEKMIREVGFDLNTTSKAPYLLPFDDKNE